MGVGDTGTNRRVTEKPEGGRCWRRNSGRSGLKSVAVKTRNCAKWERFCRGRPDRCDPIEATRRPKAEPGPSLAAEGSRGIPAGATWPEPRHRLLRSSGGNASEAWPQRRPVWLASGRTRRAGRERTENARRFGPRGPRAVCLAPRILAPPPRRSQLAPTVCAKPRGRPRREAGVYVDEPFVVKPSRAQNTRLPNTPRD